MSLSLSPARTEIAEIETRLFPMRKAIPERWKRISKDEVLGIGYPVHDLIPPSIVMDFIQALPYQAEPVPVFLFSTQTLVRLDCNSFAVKALKKKNYFTIAKKGFTAPGASAFFYANPDNHLLSRVRAFEKGVDKKILEFSREIAQSIKKFRNKAFSRHAPFVPLNTVWQWLSLKTLGNRFYKDLSVSDTCSGCGICVGKCPVGNVRISAGVARPVQTNDCLRCLRCLRCIQACPHGAINFTSSKRHDSYSPKTGRKCFQSACSLVTEPR